MRLATLPRFPLTTLPTPLQRARHLEAALGSASPRIYLKRDDLTGLAFGGNKARKLEFLVADALAHGATTLVTEGAAQSNHARLTAAAAVMAGLRCVLVLDARHGTEVAGNLLLDHLMGAAVHFAADKPARAALMAELGDQLRAGGERPYVIPTGGSVPLGAAGYVAMVAELVGQLLLLGEAPRRIYFASGSQGTQAGLVVGARAFSAPFAVYGIADEPGAAHMAETAVALANETAALLGLAERFTAADMMIDEEFAGPAYGVPTAAGLEAIRLLARTEAIFLDPVYTGKAMAGLLAHVRAGHFVADDAVIFLHTGGGPSIFVHGTVMLDASPALP